MHPREHCFQDKQKKNQKKIKFKPAYSGFTYHTVANISKSSIKTRKAEKKNN